MLAIMRSVSALVLLCVSSEATLAENTDHVSPYAGEENRAIKALSDDDIADLLQGRGWGLAKAAELNGLPGPVHVLEMKDQIALSTEQQARIEALHADMRVQAVAIGKQLVSLERELDALFRARAVDTQMLRRLLDEIGATRAELRFVHLDAHLQTPKILSPEQILRYNELRGYTLDEDPCASVPQGHDPEMWRRHNNCQ